MWQESQIYCMVWIHLGSQSVAYCFWVTVTLNSDPSSRKIMSRAYILYCFKVGIHNLEWIHVGVSKCLVLFWGLLDLDLWHIYIIGDRNPKFSVWKYLGVAECQTLLLDHCDLDPLVSFMSYSRPNQGTAWKTVIA